MAARLNAALPTGTEAITGTAATEEAQSSIAQALSFFNGFLLAFAMIALFVSAFVITNTFAILVAQRSRELALLRAIGATRSQVLRSVLAESFVIGIVGSILGLVFGILLSYGLRAMLSAIGLELPGGGILLQTRTVVVSLLVGVVVTVLAAVLPAWRASRIAPIEALRQAAAEPWQRNRTRFLAGLLVLAIGAGTLLYGLLIPKLVFAAIGAAILFIGVFILGPAIAKPVTGLISLPVAKFRGVTGTMARENTLRNPKRTARTASALTIGVALVAGVTVLTASTKTSIENTIGESFVGDFVLDSGSFGPQSGLSPTVVDELAAVPGVDKAAGFQIGLGEIDGKGDFFAVFDPTVTFDFIDVGLIAGSPADLRPGSIFLLENKAEDLGLTIGDTVTAKFPSSGQLTLTVAGLYTEAAYPGNFIVNTTDYNVAGAERLYSQAFVQLKSGVTAAETKPALEAIAATYPNADLQDRETYIKEQGAQLNQILGLFYVMLVMAIIIAAFGIMNTLRLSVLERTREIGLMRAVGMTRSQLRSTIRWESIITAVFGALLGVVLGLFLGYSIVLALRDQGTIAFTVPWLSLLIVVLLAALVGVLAAIWPARKAAAMNVLDAIATE
ncbi:MAG: FtsX-like permease family protein [Acidimicrobiales bacterium]